MSQRDKLLEKIRNNPYNVSFSDLTALLEGLGFVRIRVTGSHYIYRVGRRSVPIPRHGQTVKAYVVRLALEALDEYHGDEARSGNDAA
jgi:predicted RNA binding protein YcfA (HicA-like mRNA interferase family)